MAQFSIVVPAYNAEATLCETLDAIVEQRFDDWECLVVDDGSRDRTGSIALDYAARDSRVRVLTQPNQGTAGAYNTGVQAATGEFIVLCSADDLLLPEHLASMSRFISETPTADIYSANGYYLWPDGTMTQVYGSGDNMGSRTFFDVLRGCFFSVGATYRRELFERVGGYRVGIFGEDYDFWLRAMARGAHHAYLDALLAVHRLSASQKSSDNERVFRSDIRILTDLMETEQLSRAERTVAHDTIVGRRGRIARLASTKPRRIAGFLLVYLSHPASIVRAIMRRTRRHLAGDRS